MPKLNLVLYPNPILEAKTAVVNEFGSEIETLVADMLTTMYASKGIGLAANQVGCAKSVIVYGGSAENGVSEGHIVNPRIMERSKETSLMKEGCLSFPDLQAEVNRSVSIVVEGQNFKGELVKLEASGLLAQVFQHEIDHLNGRTFLYYLSKLKRDIFKKKMEKYKKTLTLAKFKELMLDEIMSKKNENNSAGSGGNVGIQRSEPNPSPLP